MKINKRLVYVQLVIAFAAGILSGITPLLTLYLRNNRGMHWADAANVTFFVTVISLAINPVLLFFASFRLGRNLDVQAELRTIIVSIFVGGFIGSFVGYQLGYSVLSQLVFGNITVLYNILNGVFTALSSAISLFFVSFSAISIARIMNYRANSKNEAS